MVFSDGAAGYKLKRDQLLSGFKGVAAVRPVAGEPGVMIAEVRRDSAWWQALLKLVGGGVDPLR